MLRERKGDGAKSWVRREKRQDCLELVLTFAHQNTSQSPWAGAHRGQVGEGAQKTTRLVDRVHPLLTGIVGQVSGQILIAEVAVPRVEEDVRCDLAGCAGRWHGEIHATLSWPSCGDGPPRPRV